MNCEYKIEEKDIARELNKSFKNVIDINHLKNSDKYDFNLERNADYKLETWNFQELEKNDWLQNQITQPLSLKLGIADTHLKLLIDRKIYKYNFLEDNFCKSNKIKQENLTKYGLLINQCDGIIHYVNVRKKLYKIYKNIEYIKMNEYGKHKNILNNIKLEHHNILNNFESLPMKWQDKLIEYQIKKVIDKARNIL